MTSTNCNYYIVIFLAAALLTLLLVRVRSRVEQCPSRNLRRLCTYRPDFAFRILRHGRLDCGKARYHIYGRRSLFLRQLGRQRARSFFFQLKYMTTFLLHGLVIVLFLVPRRITSLSWRKFREDIAFYWIRPQELGLVFGLAVAVERSFIPRSSSGPTMLIGLEKWMLRFAPLRGSALDHELIHATQHARFGLMTVSQRVDRGIDRVRRTILVLLSELQAHLAGSTAISALAVGAIFAMFPEYATAVYNLICRHLFALIHRIP